MSDLIKNEAEFIRNCATYIETGEPLDDDQLCNLYVIDAHRIADLIEELNERLTAATDDAKEAEAYAEQLEERNKELTLQLLATSGQAADALDKAVVAEAKLAECEARLGKAVEALRWYDNGFISPKGREVLAELEGK